jgi:hypothetical protein
MHGILNSNVSLATARSYWKRKFHVTPFSVPVRLVYQYTKRSTFARRLWYHNRATSRFCLFVVVVVVSLGYIIVVCVGDIQ